ncbi:MULTISPECIES: hypothetical protein [Bradyrhizobium]|uniref:hypothetical protein n=1 Tax=Bradyrhizobium centrosematis TaxID=1300039 RepID=UPI0021676530|nr:hypothetical protein [Bradyrhizobium centrosematis]MCS3765941.1 hypothetical protein [Bradyrhizobium centrosematis]MCS3778347.1 hypothetical protein [Bradyrhizobium centrosematis]
MLDREIAPGAIEHFAVNKLVMITGLSLALAVGILAAIGAILRFNNPQKLVSIRAKPKSEAGRVGAGHRGCISKIGGSPARHAGGGGLGSGRGARSTAGSACAPPPRADLVRPAASRSSALLPRLRFDGIGVCRRSILSRAKVNRSS